MIRGLSYQNGVFFIGKNHVSCAFDENGQIKEWIRPLNPQTLLSMVATIIYSMPFALKIGTLLFFGLLFVPKILLLLQMDFAWPGLPFYFIFYYMFGTHFLFPEQLRKYHGAEHKVFSDRGIKSRARLYWIKKAAITNRYCSTNAVVVYFSCVILFSIGLAIVIPILEAVSWGSYLAVIFVPIVNRLMKFKAFSFVRKYVLATSYFLQRKVTTTEPDRKHLLTAIQSYRKLAEVEFPEHLVAKRKVEKRMAIVDMTIIPIGTESTSVSSYVADIHRVLETYKDRVTYQLTPMSTIIEGELPVLFEVIQAVHEVPFQNGVKRVATNIRIDDRRDKPLKMTEKIKSVESKLNEAQDRKDQQ